MHGDPSAGPFRRAACSVVYCVLLAFISVASAARAQQPVPTQPASAPATPRPDETAALFNPPPSAPVPELEVRLTDDDLQKLRDNARAYVPCILFENGRELLHCGVKLKGAAGSFREVDDRPALTISTDKFNEKGETLGEDGQPPSKLFHGLEKFHLNNSVQDESLLNEWVCAEVFRGAGYPAARVAFARVSLNGRDLGMYVLKEGFDKAFLQRNFARAPSHPGATPAGNLYDGGFLQDVDADLQRDAGKGKDDHADLKRITEACRGDDLEQCWPELEKLVDIDALIRFMALERIVGHWDGYTQNRNNYRLFIPPQDSGGKAWFIPHGMDQTLNDPGYPLLDEPVGMVAVAVMRNPVWRAAFRAELTRQAAAFDAPSLVKRINAVQSRLQPALKRIDAQTARHQAQLARELIRHLRARAANIREQAARPAPPELTPLQFTPGTPVLIEGWIEAGETEGAAHEEIQLDGGAWKRLACPPVEGRCICSWRRPLILLPGRYTLEAECRAEGVEPIPGESTPGPGAGIRISGVNRTEGLTGTLRKLQRFEFDITAEGEAVLVLELRAVKGSVAFRTDSLKLTRSEAPSQHKAP